MLSFEITGVQQITDGRKIVSVTWRDGDAIVLLDSVAFYENETPKQILEKLRTERANDVRAIANPKLIHKTLIGVREDVAN